MTADWQSAKAYQGLRAAGRSALAWEVLRRDPDYPWAARAAKSILPVAAPDAFVARWGLYFRGRPKPTLRSRARHLERCRRSDCSDGVRLRCRRRILRPVPPAPFGCGRSARP
ncbi:DUF6499 domain-containing protein [Hephaestia sp. CMS5P-6]|nr:DUF6499 domain-containing protein [Hephaestia mangrovi]